MKIIFTILVFLVYLSISAKRPNIVLIMADDLGFSDLGCYGSEIDTPNLDNLAKCGLRFSQFYNTAKCHSSRISLLTGLYCDQAGSASLSRGATIAEVLKPAGYSTWMSGKWHLSKQPTDFGFQKYWGHLSGACNFFIGDNSFRLNGEDWTVPKNLNGKPFYTTHAITDFALDFIREGKIGKTSNPFFLYVAYNAPHYPLHAPKKDVLKYSGKYDGGWDNLRNARYAKQISNSIILPKFKLSPRAPHVPSWNSIKQSEKLWEADRMEVFAAMVDLVDQNIGRLIEDLKRRKVFDDTLFLFCSDNGGCPFERTRGRNLKPWDPNSYWTYDASWSQASNTPFRLYKQNQHEGGISSPLIAHWPNGLRTEAGSITRQPAHLIDFMATFLELGHAKYPKEVGDRIIDPLEGRSLTPIFKGKQRREHETLYFRFGTDRALRQGKWKLVSAKGGKWELYDIENDRTELNDLSAKFPRQVSAMASEWFNIAQNKERLKQKGLTPVKENLKQFSFRKDTSDQLNE
ncbi:MAG: arylsulfatase [Opitutales bacterium]|nr:arylsulfatase [Opitutales bacterium]